jgi:phosphate transport system protein
MPTTPQGFNTRIDRLKSDLVEQGRRVQALLESAYESLFGFDADRAERVIAGDDEIDRVDVAIEKASVSLLADATNENAALTTDQLRRILTIVKVNNELERIADAAVAIAERVEGVGTMGIAIPGTFRVMANSVVGIVRDAVDSLDRRDPALAKLVLQSQDAVSAFKAELLRDSERRIASGSMSVDFAFALHELASQCELIDDHCTNIAEQVIYAATGAIVRHTAGHWSEVQSKS